jgi:zinc transport system ATP-binding protein
MPHSPDAPALFFDGVGFSYSEARVLHAVSFTVETSGLTAVIGPNGGGKTTLLKLALGLLPPQAGRVEVFGARPHRACSRVGYVPQYMTLQPDFPLTVREAVGMGCNHRRVAEDRALEQAGIQDLAGRSFAELSGGQRQRVLIARALAGCPGLLLLDEPTAAIDPAFAEQLRDLVFELAETLAVLVVSHDLAFVEERTDQTVFLNRSSRVLSSEELNSDLLWSLYRNIPEALHG